MKLTIPVHKNTGQLHVTGKNILIVDREAVVAAEMNLFQDYKNLEASGSYHKVAKHVR